MAGRLRGDAGLESGSWMESWSVGNKGLNKLGLFEGMRLARGKSKSAS